ncbi:hypothetical protein E4T66_20810 [Sinimarinibacterium sp. CAU 1509]|uniref:hypothetical protein n=1 Tax=Sinimarinibacterium sp. CAU 1509 TaxID=2562283 RepID=UPI0010ABCE3E|nr:hypothetical protein [Sinimarinibacterium sp. CAU 1509]TJY55554.1 hypothetical protein E4T66_20810 [Sinimarinibacterium sp. CAU 1509]
MPDIDQRVREAEALWQQGDALLAAGDGRGAYAAYTQAHDQVTDCPRLHETAHRKLRQVSRAHGHRGEVFTDIVLVWLAPLRIFELIALAMRSRVAAEALCRRSATPS